MAGNLWSFTVTVRKKLAGKKHVKISKDNRSTEYKTSGWSLHQNKTILY